MTIKLFLPVCIALGLSACGGSSSADQEITTGAPQPFVVTQSAPQSGDIVLNWPAVNDASYYELLRYRSSTSNIQSEVVAKDIKDVKFKMDLDLVDIDGVTAEYELLACRTNNVCFKKTPRFEVEDKEQYVIRLKTPILHGDESYVPHFGRGIAWHQGDLFVNAQGSLIDVYVKQTDGNYAFDKNKSSDLSIDVPNDGSITHDIVTTSNDLDELILAGARTPNEGSVDEAYIYTGKIKRSELAGQKEELNSSGKKSDGYGASIAFSEQNGKILVSGNPTQNGSGEVYYYVLETIDFPSAQGAGLSSLRAPKELAVKKPDTLASDAQFGASVSIAMDEVLAIGAPMDSIDKGNPEEIKHTGAVYIYRKSLSPNNIDEVWQLETVLNLPRVSAIENSQFGSSLQLNREGNLLVVGVPGIDKVLIYRHDDQRGFWSKVDSIDPIKVSKGQKFGYKVALSDDRYLAVTAKDAPWRGFGLHTSPDTLELGGDSDGAVYIYHLTKYGDRDYAWEGVITGDSVSGVDEKFGESLKFNPGTHKLAIGAPGHPSDPSLDWEDRSWTDSGAVYIF